MRLRPRDEFAPLRLDAYCEPVDPRLVGEIAVVCDETGVARMGTWNTVTPYSLAASGTRLSHWAIALTQSAIELADLGVKRNGCAIGPGATNPVRSRRTRPPGF